MKNMNEKNHFKIIGIITVLMLLCVACVGVASAQTHEAETAAELDTLFGSGEGAASTGDTIKLTDSFTMNGKIDVPNKNLTLDLNGKTLTASAGKRLFVVDNNATFTLKDSASTGGGKLQGNGSVNDHGAGIYIPGESTFIMESGRISNCIASGKRGGGVYVNGGTFTMKGGEISGNTAANGGGVYVNGGMFEMDDGKISSNTATNNDWGGGGVYINTNGNFSMNGGDISGNTAANGGGVFVNDATFIMTAGNISGNTASNRSGGVYVNGGKFTMKGGEISGNTGLNGGGVYVNGGTFEMDDGKISGNTATSNNQWGGCGVYVNENGTFTMKGGEITGNAANNGGGVYHYSNVQNAITIGNTAKIIGNSKTNGTAENNVYLRNGKTISISSDTPIMLGACIGVITESTPSADGYVAITGTNSKDFSGYFTSDAGYNIINDSNTVKLAVNTGTHVNGVSLPSNVTIAVGGSEKLQAIINPTNATNKKVIWCSSNPTVAAVDESGKVTGVKTGTATIIVATVDGSKTATCTVTVVKPAPTYKVTVNSGSHGTGGSASPSVAKAGTTITLTEPTADDGWKFGGWVSGEATIRNNSFVMPAENVTVTAYYNAVQRPEDRKSSSSSTSFSGSSVTKSGSVFTFTNSVVVKEATLPGAESATITNKSGPGWYNFDLTAPGFTGNGSMLFQVPLDVIAIKGFTKDDVGLYHQVNGKWVLEPTYLLSTDNQYGYYKGTFDSCSPFSINFAEGVTAKEVTTTPITETPVKPVSVEISGVSAMKVGDTTILKAANSDGSSAKFAWKSSDDSVATVDENGNLKAVKAGTATITVTNNITGKTATKTITVAAKAEPEKQQTTKSPFPVLGILVGIGVAGVLVLRRKN